MRTALDLRNYFVAVLSALLRSVQFASQLGIASSEAGRYLRKSASLALCYAGLGSRVRVREAWLAGEAGFLCCAYDVATDWRAFDEKSFEGFQKVVDACVASADLRAIALSLYSLEKAGGLSEDGLERGPIALRFTLGVMGCESDRQQEWGDLDVVGRRLQIVDDVLDYEEDLVRGEKNCLASNQRLHCLQELARWDDDTIRRLFGGRPSLIVRVIDGAKQKAAQLLSQPTGGLPLSPHVRTDTP